MKNSFRVGVVATNYNNSNYTLEMIKSIAIADMSDVEIDIVVVDNASESKQKALLGDVGSISRCAHVIYNNCNEGYFTGLNIGIEYLYAKNTKFDCIVVGNNDLVFPIDFFQRLKLGCNVFVKEPVICPDIVTLDGVHQNPHVITKTSPVREFLYDLYFTNFYLARLMVKVANLTRKITSRTDHHQHDVACHIYQGYGACYILGPLFIEHFRLLWAPTFLMGEELFLSKQLADKGYRQFYYPAFTVLHHDHASTGKIPNRKMWEISKESHKVYRKHVPYFQ